MTDTTGPQDTLARLQAAGFDLNAFTDDQREVLGALTPHELGVLVDIKGRLDETGPEVQAHADIAGGALF
ncbi:aroma-sacti cluster domain-containing protein [Kitasatospora sp. NPDC049285]|uniref:aroma-sacti cluster domain-containing protein n=1 Tax=Kitasatospora sp. NPDC049285 TaxID=3157096 RepID=UPI00342ED2A6